MQAGRGDGLAISVGTVLSYRTKFSFAAATISTGLASFAHIMKILQIVSSSRISGAEKHVVVLSNCLLRRGNDVLAICPRGDWLPDQLRDAGVPRWELRFRGTYAIRCLMEVLRYVRNNRVDLIHTHLTKATYIGYLVARLTGLPLISSLHTRTRDLVYRRLMPGPNNRIITVSNFLRDMLICPGYSRLDADDDIQRHRILRGGWAERSFLARPRIRRGSAEPPAAPGRVERAERRGDDRSVRPRRRAKRATRCWFRPRARS